MTKQRNTNNIHSKNDLEVKYIKQNNTNYKRQPENMFITTLLLYMSSAKTLRHDVNKIAKSEKKYILHLINCLNAYYNKHISL